MTLLTSHDFSRHAGENDLHPVGRMRQYDGDSFYSGHSASTREKYLLSGS